MPITYPLSLPSSPAPASIEWSPLSAAGVSASPFTFAAEKVLHAGRKLEAAVSYPLMTRAQGDAFAAALTSLDASYGNFLFGPQGPGATPKGVATGTPVVQAANQTGQSLYINGCTASVMILKAGDWIQLGSGATARLHMQLVDVNTDGTGFAELTLWPHLRAIYAIGAALVWTNPQGIFRLAESPQWAIGPGYIYEALHLRIVEDF